MFNKSHSQCSLAAIAGLLAVTILQPMVSKAAPTSVEFTAAVFPAITVQRNENVLLCTNNLSSDGALVLLIGLLDVADSSRFALGTQPVQVTLDRHKGACAMLLPVAQNSVTPAGARTGIPAIFILQGGGSRGFGDGGGAGRVESSIPLASSVQLLGMDGSVKAVASPGVRSDVTLPAVQRPQ